MSHTRPFLSTFALFFFAAATGSLLAAEADPRATAQIEQLVRQLNAREAADRDEAERNLIALGTPGEGGAGPQAVLELLPESNDRMPPEVRHRLARVRQALEEADAKAAVSATHVTLDADEMPLAEVFAAIESRTGNRILDQRNQFGQELLKTPLTIELKDRPFWPAFDEILDRAELTTYTFSGEDALIVRPRTPGSVDRVGRAHYAGPFRIEATEVHATRNLRTDGGDALRVMIEIAWEPRLRPIRISQPLDSLTAVDADGNPLATSAMAQGELEVPINVGNQAAELQLLFTLPPRSVEKIARLSGTLNTVVPGRMETFRFQDLAAADGKEQRRGGATVTLDRLRKNGPVWELYMRVAFDDASGALESHRGWVLQNASYLVVDDGTRIENVGFETTHQTEQEIGLAYLFELPTALDDLQGLAWEYQTPAAIIPLPIEYELTDIALP